MIVRGKGTLNNVLIIVMATFLTVLVFNNIPFMRGQGEMVTGIEILESFSTIFLSIILEAVPFIMIGTFVSSIIQVFVSEEVIARVIPKNMFVGLLMASLVGFVFPVCECAIVPIMRRLIKKGVPLGIAVTFMTAVPIVNPVVLASTYYAFSDRPYFVLLRGGLGVLGAILIGYIITVLQDRENPLKNQSHDHTEQICSCGHHHHGGHSCGHEDGHNHEVGASKMADVIGHMGEELYDVGKMLIIGALIASLMQTFISRSLIFSIGQGPVSSTVVMMAMAFVLSLCSEADAFIARTFVGQFTTGSIAAFLILGPMIDIKNTLMLWSGFKGRFVIKIILVICAVCFILASLVNTIVF